MVMNICKCQVCNKKIKDGDKNIVEVILYPEVFELECDSSGCSASGVGRTIGFIHKDCMCDKWKKQLGEDCD